MGGSENGLKTCEVDVPPPHCLEALHPNALECLEIGTVDADRWRGLDRIEKQISLHPCGHTLLVRCISRASNLPCRLLISSD